METAEKLKYLVGVYLVVLVFLLLAVVAMPLIIQHRFHLTSDVFIEEESLESTLIVLLFAASFFILRAFQRTLKSYRRAAHREGKDKSRLLLRLAEAFSYIGTVNVEFKEIQSILCGVEQYPRTKKEFKQLLENYAVKVMTVIGTPWIVFRMISRCSGRTVKEYTAEHRKGTLPSATMGNRAILEGRLVEGLRFIGSRQKNLDLMTVCIMPTVTLSEEQNILVAAIANQIEMIFMLFRSGCLRPELIEINDLTEKEIHFDTHH
jgi:hypothetical protein